MGKLTLNRPSLQSLICNLPCFRRHVTSPNQGLPSLASWGVKRRDPGNEVARFLADQLSQLSQVADEFAKALEMRHQVVIIYLEFSKAFDRVPHEMRVLYKLECLGVSGPLLSWFRSYLSGRRHRAVLNNEASDFLPVTSGVPQGSILGPLLFVIFINDMPNAISKETSLPLFADDSKCFRLVLGREYGDKLQDDLNELFRWS